MCLHKFEKQMLFLVFTGCSCFHCECRLFCSKNVSAQGQMQGPVMGPCPPFSTQTLAPAGKGACWDGEQSWMPLGIVSVARSHQAEPKHGWETRSTHLEEVAPEVRCPGGSPKSTCPANLSYKGQSSTWCSELLT